MGKEAFGRWAVVALCVCAVAATAESAQVIYVDDDVPEAGNGASWQTACKYLQDALALAAVAAKPVEIRVAAGVYKPDQGAGVTPGDRAATFQLLNGVTLKGGYAGLAAADGDDRDLRQHETILSGDLRGDDIEVSDPCQLPAEASLTRAENSIHVVTASGTDPTAGLDGFTITAGCSWPVQTSLPSNPGGGSAMYNEAGSPTVRQCLFRTNLSFPGGAVYNHGGSPTFSRCTFERNGSFSRGGAMHNNDAEPVLTGCTFSGNVTLGPGQGGALTNEWYTHAVLEDCVFANNGSGEGGAIYSGTASTLNLEQCDFEGNRASSLRGAGGAVFSEGDTTMTDCTFNQNSATREGGAVRMGHGMLHVSRCGFTANTIEATPSSFTGGGALYCQSGVIAAVADTKFEGNVAVNGGAIRTSSYSLDVARCSFADNVAWFEKDTLFVGQGGAIYSEYTWLRLTDCTFDRNQAMKEGGAVWGRSRRAFLTRCDFAGNGAERGGALFGGNLGAPVANCLFSGNRARQGGAIFSSFGDIVEMRNCTFADNSADEGPTFACENRPDAVLNFSHCILWDGPDPFWSEFPLQRAVVYSDVRGGHEGEGNIEIDPDFVHPGRWTNPGQSDVPATAEDPNAVWVAGDYHLRSQGGHWDRKTKTWVRDNQTSFCIDTGDPLAPFNVEPFPNGGIVNLGAYGGTAEASKSYFGEPVCDTAIAGDINGDCKVDAVDQDLMMRNWLVTVTPAANQPPTVVISQPLDGAVIEVKSSDSVIPVVADAADSDGSIEEVRFFIEYRGQENLRRTSSLDAEGADGWRWSWNWRDSQHPYAEGQYTIHAYAVDDEGALTLSPPITLTIRNQK